MPDPSNKESRTISGCAAPLCRPCPCAMCRISSAVAPLAHPPMAKRSALGFHTSSAVQFSIARMAVLSWIPPCVVVAITCASGAAPS
eukprot:8272827-Lingulodinium_polyedra.AAC.1